MISVNDVSDLKWLSQTQLTGIEIYINQCIDNWCTNNSNQTFSVSDIFGNKNWNWNSTPLQVLYDYELNLSNDSQKAFDKAGYFIGILLNKVVAERSDIRVILRKTPYKYKKI